MTYVMSKGSDNIIVKPIYLPTSLLSVSSPSPAEVGSCLGVKYVPGVGEIQCPREVRVANFDLFSLTIYCPLFWYLVSVSD